MPVPVRKDDVVGTVKVEARDEVELDQMLAVVDAEGSALLPVPGREEAAADDDVPLP